jgi:hypothetical protein
MRQPADQIEADSHQQECPAKSQLESAIHVLVLDGMQLRFLEIIRHNEPPL